jgi:hypothetical protein
MSAIMPISGSPLIPETEAELIDLSEDENFDFSRVSFEPGYKYGPKKLSRKHYEIFRIIATDPLLSNGEVARRVGVTESWLSIVINTDMFKALMEAYKRQVVSSVTASLQEKTHAAVNLAMDRIIGHLQQPVSDPDYALTVATKLGSGAGLPLSKANGTGLSAQNQVNVFVASKEELAHARELLVRFHDNIPPLEEGKPQLNPAGQIIEGEKV